MPRIFTLLIAMVCISAVWGQSDFNKIQKINSPAFDTDKIIPAEIQSADDLSRKISPLLNTYLTRVQKNTGPAFQSSKPLMGFDKILAFREEAGSIILPVFIKSSDISSSVQAVLSGGGKVGAIAEDIITAELPVSSLKFIAQNANTVYIDASSISELKTDISRTETKTNQIHNGTGLPRSYKGNGVIVGVVDSGIDWKHPDFSNAGGNRIRYIWDMSGNGNPPTGYDYGTEYTKTQLDANQCNEKDLDDGGGHGTHVSGTAAGNGGANSSYVGMAPESDIIFVKGFKSSASFSDADVVNGCQYIFNKAQQLQKPAVINLSLGGHYGPHDGSSLYEQALSNLTGNGKIIVAAAGNEGGDVIHLSYTASGSSTDQASETILNLYYGTSIFAADMWYNTGNISVGIAAYDTATGQLLGFTPPVGPGNKTEDLAFTVQNYTYGWVTIDATGTNNANNQANEVVIVIDSHNGQVGLAGAYWTLYTYGSGTLDAWAFTGGQFSDYSQNFKPGDNLKTIGSPGTAKKLICIGSYVTKDHWTNIDGTTSYQDGNPVIGKISSFSSLGPTRDGRIKPCVVAPGEVIIAAYSSFLTQTPRPWILWGGKHQKMQGTSMATPHVTGIVALMLEKNPNLNYDQIVNYLQNTAIKDAFTGNTPNNTYGSGKIDAYNAFLSVGGGGGGEVQTADLIYDDGTPYSWYSWPGANQGSASRMTTTLSNATLSKMEIYIMGTSAGTATYKPIVLSSNGGQPGDPLVALTSRTAQNVPGWDATDLTSYNIPVSGDFFIGIFYDGTNQPRFGYDQANNGRSWDYENYTWSAWNETYFMRATIKTVVSEAEIGNEVPGKFELSQNYPNPFNPLSSFRLSIPEGRNTKVTVYDIQGRKIAELINNFLNPGVYTVTWNGKNDEGASVSSGAYFYTVQAGDFFQVKKMILLK